MGKSRNTRRERGADAAAVVEAVDGGLAELLPDRDRARAWTLLIDGAPQSHVDLDDPAYLSFEYQRRLGHVIDLAAAPGRPLHVVHLGGGAFTLARYVAATRPRSTQQVVERDAALVRLVRRELPSIRGPGSGSGPWTRGRVSARCRTAGRTSSSPTSSAAPAPPRTSPRPSSSTRSAGR